MSDIAHSEHGYWRKCSACKRPIAFGQVYQECSVSTCSKKRSGFVFCSVPCWASHVPTFRHRDAWALEKHAPTKEQFMKELQTEDSPKESPSPKKESVPMSQQPASSPQQLEKDILIVVSKMKAYIKATSDLNTSGDVMDLLSDRVRRLCDQAVKNARADGRKTVMARDFRD